MPDMTDPKSPLSYLSPGQKLGKYEIRAVIGRGGSAEVYRAHDPDLNREVAIKVLHPNLLESDEAIVQLRQEGQAVAALNHPNIIHVFDFHAEGQVFFMVMELINGPTLHSLIRKHPDGMPVEVALHVFTQVLKAVEYAHSHGVIHRDIKPSNVLIAEGFRAVLMDFGLARPGGSERLTAQGMASGTPLYLAPELLDGKAVQPTGDIYALGVMLYEMVTGQTPFKGTSYVQVIRQQLEATPRPPSELVPSLPPEIERVILRALEKDPARRYQSAQAMLDDLTAGTGSADLETPDLATLRLAIGSVQGNPRTVRGSTVLTQTFEVMTRNPVLSAGFIVSLVLVLGIAVIVYEIRQALNSAATSVPQPGNLLPATVAPAAPEGMVFIPGGTFQMGTTQGAPNEAPIHDVTLSDYFLDRTEVTNKAYLTFVVDTAREPPQGWLKPESKNWIIDATNGFAAGNPMQRFSYDGSTVTPFQGTAHYDVNAEQDTGEFSVELDGTLTYQDGVTKTGHWKIVQKSFSNDQPFFQGGVATNVEMHGDTGQEAPFYPSMIGTLATWGTADLYFNGQIEVSDLGIHTMFIHGLRDAKHEILKRDQTCCYDKAEPENGYVDPAQDQVNVLLFTPGLYTPAKPTKEAIWLELYFTKVDVRQKPDSTSGVAFPPGTGNRPVTNVTYLDAAAYCEYVKKRLPTEAEWEHAARGPQNWRFPWGNTSKVNGIIPANWTSGELKDVGGYPAGQSYYGVQDMAGNAWEWVTDWYDKDYYAASPKQNPTGPANGLTRVLRGGGFSQLDPAGPPEYTATFRLDRPPDTVDPSIGFRCARDAQPLDTTPAASPSTGDTATEAAP